MRLKPLVTALCAGALLAANTVCAGKRSEVHRRDGGRPGHPVLRADHQRCRAGKRASWLADNVKVTLVSSGYDLASRWRRDRQLYCREGRHDHPQRCGFQRDRPGGEAREGRRDRGFVAVDVAAEGADATITSDNTQAGEMACKYITDRLKGKGNVW